MAKFKALSSVPVVNAHEYSEALTFYTQKLGFDVAFQLGAYAGLQLGDAWVHINGEHDEWSAIPISVRFSVQGIDDYYASLDQSIVMAEEQLKDMSFGSRQFSVLDPSGNRITFSQPIV